MEHNCLSRTRRRTFCMLFELLVALAILIKSDVIVRVISDRALSRQLSLRCEFAFVVASMHVKSEVIYANLVLSVNLSFLE